MFRHFIGVCFLRAFFFRSNGITVEVHRLTRDGRLPFGELFYLSEAEERIAHLGFFVASK
jgi:hypothetical protein